MIHRHGHLDPVAHGHDGRVDGRANAALPGERRREDQRERADEWRLSHRFLRARSRKKRMSGFT